MKNLLKVLGVLIIGWIGWAQFEAWLHRNDKPEVNKDVITCGTKDSHYPMGVRNENGREQKQG